MTSLDFSAQTQQSKDLLAVTLAALVLHDNGAEITSQSLAQALKAANVNVAPQWPALYARGLEGKKIGDFLSLSSGSSGPAPAQAQAEAKGPAKEEKKAEAPPAEEEVDMDMGDLFG